MYDHLREGDLHALYVKEDLYIPGQHALGIEKEFLGRIHREFQVDAALAEQLHALVAYIAQVEVGVLGPQSRQRSPRSGRSSRPRAMASKASWS